MIKYSFLLYILFTFNLIGQQSFDWCFIENNGQFNSDVRFKHQLNNGALFLQNTGLTYHLLKEVGHKHDDNAELTLQHHAFSVKFEGANKKSAVIKSEVVPHYFNYIMDANHSFSNVRGYQKVQYTDVYRSIDFVMYDAKQKLKYDFIVKKGGDPSEIQLKYNDLNNLYIDAQGRLHLENEVSEVIEDAPYVYQIINSKKVKVSARYVLKNNTVSFDFPNGYNSKYNLVIDPTLIMSTYSGATDHYSTNCTTYDQAGNLYVAGGNRFAGFPVTAGAYQTVYLGIGADNVAIQKFNQAGALLFATYFGGEGSYPLDLAINNNQNLVVLVATVGGMPASAASAQPTIGGGTDYGIGIMTPDGASVIEATYLGGTGNEAFGAAASDNAAGLFIDAGNNILVCGGTESIDFPVSAGAFQGALSGVSDGVIASFNGALTAQNWATYLGGSGEENANSVAIGPNGNVYVVGNTNSVDFPTTAGVINGAQIGLRDGFVTELSANGAAIFASSYLGTNQDDRAKFILINDADEVFIGGSTNGAYPISAGVFSSPSQNNLFVHKLNNTLTTTLFSTAVGCLAVQQPEIFMTAMGLDYCEKIYFTGASTGNNFPTTPDAYTTAEKGLYMCVLEPNAVALHYGTYFGGNVNGQHFHPGSKSKYNNQGVLFHTECTQSVDYPILNGVNTQNGATFDGASFIFDFEFDLPLTQTAIPAPSGCDFPVTLSAVHPSNNNVSYLWSTGETTPTIDVNSNGEYKVIIYNFCDTIKDSVDVNLAGAAIDFTIDKNVACAENSFSFTDLSIDVPANSTYLWEFGDGGVSESQNPTHVYNSAGLYTVSLTITGNGCKGSEVKNDTITIHPKPTANFSFSPEILDIEDPHTQFINTSSSDVVSLIWYFNVDGQTSVLQNPEFTFPGERGNVYPVNLVVENSFGCKDMVTKQVTVQDVITLYVPNSFTPDGGSENRVFQPVITSGVDPYNFRLLIFNRWGEIMFESRDYTKAWDGMYNNEIVEQGAYVWQIDFKETMSSVDRTYRGHVTVLR